MIFIIMLVVAGVFIRIFSEVMRKHPGPFYIVASAIAVTVIALYWANPAFIGSSLRNNIPQLTGALGTAMFIYVMIAGALPAGNSWQKRLMLVRGELSIFACLLTLAHNLSLGKTYFTKRYLFSGPVTNIRIAAWISVIMIILMLILTVTSIKAIRKKMRPKRWKSLQRFAYLFYALIYTHVMLLSVPNVLKGRTTYIINVLVYSIVFIGYAVCRIQKAVFVMKKQGNRVTMRRQLIGFCVGSGIAVLLTVGLYAGGKITSARQDVSENEIIENETVFSSEDDIESLDSDDSYFENENIEIQYEETVGEDNISESLEPEPQMSSEPQITGEASDEVNQTPEPSSNAIASSSPAEASSSAPVQSESTPQTSAQPEETSAEPEPSSALPEETVPVVESKYKDGTYTGTGQGCYGKVTVSVTISGDRITNISVVNHSDDPEYMDDVISNVIPAIINNQSTNVSAVSGATYSSEGVMEAVEAALKKAEN